MPSRQWWLYQGAALYSSDVATILLIPATKTGVGAVDSGGCIRVQHFYSSDAAMILLIPATKTGSMGAQETLST